jgi:polyketide biosynthesis acyl carrier protein
MNRDYIFNIIKRQTLNVLPHVNEASITIDEQLKNLGANSMDRMDIVIASMEELGVKIPLLELAKASNINALVEILYAARV